jgi:acyl-CoA reductase-like NAD-dependent aldehyde dehydrogenase
MEVRFPWDDSLVAEVAAASPADVDAGIANLHRSGSIVAALPRADRRRILKAIGSAILERREDLAESIVLQTGKTIRDARGEVLRAVSTFEFAAEAAASLVGDVLPLDAMPGAEDRWGWTERVPVGVVVGIPAVNFPLLITAHKLAPAIGAGCPIAIKPPERAPLSALELGRIAVDAGWPAEAVRVLPGGPDVAQHLVGDDRVRLVSFTGSTQTGRAIAERAGMKRLLLELGSNAATVLAADAPVDLALSRCVSGGVAHNGQSCISVQRIYVHESLYETFVERIAEAAAELRVGDPRSETTDVGPVIDDASAERLQELVDDAKTKGALVSAGGSRDGRMFAPTVLAGLTHDMRAHKEEAFGPLMAVASFRTLEEAVALVNDSVYGLQAGVFTKDLRFATDFARKTAVGGVHINETSNWRADHMPYGGVKDSGFGREGPASAMREMTTTKVISVRDIEE